jgi:hypothetical protein
MNTLSIERLQSLFETHPDAAYFIITSDGMPFFDELTAGSHAQRLLVKDFTEVSREDVENGSLGDLITAPVLAPFMELSEAVGASYKVFVKNEGGEETGANVGHVVPASDILASESSDATIKDAISNAMAEVKTLAKKTAEIIAPQILKLKDALDEAKNSKPVIEVLPFVAPVIEAPAFIAPVIEAPVFVAPVIETPAVIAPFVDAPAVVAPVVETPEIIIPVVVAPVVKAPAKTVAKKPVAKKPAVKKILTPKI